MSDMPDIDALLARAVHHALDRNPNHAARCVACSGVWPCETEQWAAAVRSLRAAQTVTPHPYGQR